MSEAVAQRLNLKAHCAGHLTQVSGHPPSNGSLLLRLVAGACTIWSSAHAADWPSLNSSLSLSTTALDQHYREIDSQGLTADGTLNTERGTVGGWAVQGRWQGALGPVPLWLQASTQWAQGQTRYNGYLQSGSTLTPFQANTGNTWRSHSLALGVPLAMAPGDQVQLIPHLQWASQHWQRNLVQYGETYRHHSAGLGLLAQWAATDRLTLEAATTRRWQSRASVAVPALGFAAEQGRGTETELSFAARWHINQRWHLLASASRSRFQNGASPVQQGLQAPPNAHQTTRMSVGLGMSY